MLETLAKKAFLKQAFASHLEKLARPMPMAPAPSAPQPANYKPGNLPKPKPGHVPWYKTPTAKAVGTGLSIASMAIPWTWAGRGLVGLGMLARGGSMLSKGKKAVQIGSQLKKGQTTAQAVTRGNQMRRTGAATMRQGQQIKNKAQGVLGTGPGKFRVKSPKTYAPALANTMTAPGGKGLMGGTMATAIGVGNVSAIKQQVGNVKAGRLPYQNAPAKVPAGPPPAGTQGVPKPPKVVGQGASKTPKPVAPKPQLPSFGASRKATPAPTLGTKRITGTPAPSL